MKAQVENRFGKKSEMTELGTDYVRMQMSPQTSWQMKVLALSDTTKVVCLVSTACAPACDSSHAFLYDRLETACRFSVYLSTGDE